MKTLYPDTKDTQKRTREEWWNLNIRTIQKAFNALVGEPVGSLKQQQLDVQHVEMMLHNDIETYGLYTVLGFYQEDKFFHKRPAFKPLVAATFLRTQEKFVLQQLDGGYGYHKNTPKNPKDVDELIEQTIQILAS